MPRFVVCYDVTDDRRRRKIAKILDSYGDRVQESVFEMVLEEEAMEECRSRIENQIDQAEDCIAIYRLCRSCERSRQYLYASDPRIGEETVFVV